MKTTVRTFLLLVFASAFLAACEDCNDVNISEPTVEDTDWLVYTSGDTAFFRNQAGETVRFVRTGIFVQSVPGEGFSIEDECISELNTQLTNIMENEQRNLPFLGTFILKKPDSLLVRVGVGSELAWNIPPDGETQEKTVLGNTYEDVYVLQGESTAPDAAKTVFFNKENGFLMIEFNNGNKLELIDVR